MVGSICYATSRELQANVIVQILNGCFWRTINGCAVALRSRPMLNDNSPQSSAAALGRQHSAAIGCFRQVKPQRPVSGDELDETSVASGPKEVVLLMHVSSACGLRAGSHYLWTRYNDDNYCAAEDLLILVKRRH